MIQTVDISTAEHKVRFSLDLDPYYAQDAAIIHFLRTGKPPEPELAHLMLRLLRPGDFVVDGGANIGFFSLLANACGAAVTAVEPCEATVKKLLRNIELNEGWIGSVRQTALMAESGRVPFYQRADSGFNSVWGDEGEPQSVPCTTLVEVCNGRAPRLIKLDLEGCELWALKGGRSLFQELKSVFVVVECNTKALARMNSTIAEMRYLMCNCGYDTFRLDPNGGIPALIPRQSEVVSRQANSNILFAQIAQIAKVWPKVEI